ncbi:MAG: 50S ribosomal protein L21 [Armatimonadetes bacterium]|nr:50S ribosomal protein L21 [Armatimonadota bacterium]
MYAVVEAGGRQYRVEAGTVLRLERLEAAPGEEITLDRVLLVVDGERIVTGTPVVQGATVHARVLGERRGRKIIVFKYKPKTRYRRLRGHRQSYTEVQVDRIEM